MKKISLDETPETDFYSELEDEDLENGDCDLDLDDISEVKTQLD